MLYSEWVKTNTGIFYQLNRAKILPFTTETITVDNIDQEFLLENANKEMFSNDTNTLVHAILAKFYHQWQDLATFYKTIEPGTTGEIISTSSNDEQTQSKMALNDTSEMFTTGGNNSNATGQTSTKTKNYSHYNDFVLSNDLYDIIKKQIRKYLFINVY